MSFKKFLLLSISSCALLNSCDSNKKENTLFTKIETSHSRLTFENTITETDSLNILDYEYMYNGAGVGVGDFNGDGLQDLFFAGNMVDNKLYINQGDLKFKDETESAGVSSKFWCTGVSIVDINNDGLPDIYVSTVHDQEFNDSPNRLYVNTTKENGKVTFEEISSEVGLADTSYSIQSIWLDYDKDQDLDLFIINNSMEEYPKNNPLGQKTDGKGKSTDKLYQNLGIQENGLPKFKDVSQEAGILTEGWSLGVVVTDINDDSYPDLYVANDFISSDVLYVNNQDGTFTNKIKDYFKHVSHNSMGIDVSDLNNDAAPDFLVVDMLPEDNLRKKTMFESVPFSRFNRSLEMGYSPQYVRNVLQLSNKNQQYSEVGYFSGVAETDWSWSPLIADFDNDGLRDIYITNGYKKDITDLDFVDFTNQGSTFGTPEARRKRMLDQVKQMKGVKKSNFFFKNAKNGQFTVETAEAGLNYPSFSNGGVYVDLDNDGDLDLVTNNIDDPVLLFENHASEKGNYFRVELPPNVFSLGAKVWIFTSEGNQYAEFNPQRGYMSSMEPTLHFGLGDIEIIDSLKIVWPNNEQELLTNLKVNQRLPLEPKKGKGIVPANSISDKKATKTYFTASKEKDLTYKHKENGFDDFKNWPLHYRSYSKNGPVLAVGDVNNDGNEDLFVGGTKGVQGRFYLQNSQQEFQERFITDSTYVQAEDTGALFIDFDNDGDLDLYCVSGSSENYYDTKLYQDRIYKNDGNGNFTLTKNVLPTIESAGKIVVPWDYDQDDDLDLFVGGRVLANEYPKSPRSYLLKNDGGNFTDVTKEVAPQLLTPGMVTGASAEDINNDGKKELILVGEWMPIQVFSFNKGKVALEKSVKGLEKTEGWWTSLKSADFDNDGDIDFVVGNWGLNNPFEASVEEPISIYAKDYDNNGSLDPIFTYFIDGKEYIAHPRGTLTGQLPGLKRYLNTYREYGEMQVHEVFNNNLLEGASVFRAYQLASVYIENLGNNSFSVKELPNKAQWAPIMDMHITDVNADGKMDILSVGNFYGNEVITGSIDAGNGDCLLFSSDNFITTPISESGFDVPAEARSIVSLKKGKDEKIFIGLQNDSLQVFQKQNFETIKE
ncbi:VCBS repeat-containing protein [Galbibacter mesophilus]|uniref:VCBS repeat-containing protein n=1 Tax=Galbibacter mesophilus TaxID=379069 RepID=UPI00191F0516|nr:VCBS repeat-containing protein [Galbibacter mesophilus]MCM5663069.1 VCBS repeat-containing protein [Galbibacter mesophilus]